MWKHECRGPGQFSRLWMFGKPQTQEMICGGRGCHRYQGRKVNLFSGQVILEFTFCMAIVLLMIFATMMIFRWAGLDLAERRRAHDNSLMTFYPDGDPARRSLIRSYGPYQQLDPYFYDPQKMNAVWDGTGGGSIWGRR